MQLDLLAEACPLGLSATAKAVLPTPPIAAPSPRPSDPSALLQGRLRDLGLPAFARFETHRNSHVMLSWIPGKRIRVHEGYAGAPDSVLDAIVRFVKATRRSTRTAARRVFLGFPAEVHAPCPPRRVSPRTVSAADRAVLERLRQLHGALNHQHFAGALKPIVIHLSGRMRTRLGEVRLDRRSGLPTQVGISRRHLRRDGWEAVQDTLLHEMIHQWQAETGRPVDHGRGFREQARRLGIEPRAVLQAVSREIRRGGASPGAA